MYKGASRFRQHLSDEGRKLVGQRRSGSKQGKLKTVRVAMMDAAAEEAKLKNWAAYIRHCRDSNIAPQVPDEILARLRERKLID